MSTTEGEGRLIGCKTNRLESHKSAIINGNFYLESSSLFGHVIFSFNNKLQTNMFPRVFLLDIAMFILCSRWYILCFGLRMTLSRVLKVRVDSSLPMQFCCLHAAIPRAISGHTGEIDTTAPARSNRYR